MADTTTTTYRTITPYLLVADANAELAFLTAAFGATEVSCQRNPDNTVMHAEVMIGDSLVMLGQAGGQWKPREAALYLWIGDVDATSVASRRGRPVMTRVRAEDRRLRHAILMGWTVTRFSVCSVHSRRPGWSTCSSAPPPWGCTGWCERLKTSTCSFEQPRRRRTGKTPPRSSSALLWRMIVSQDRRVQKFRSGEAMNAAPPVADDTDFDRFLRHCARFWALAPRTYPRGVFKFRTIEEAQQARSQHAG